MRRHFSCFSKYFMCSSRTTSHQDQQQDHDQNPPSSSQIDLYDSDDDEAHATEPKYNMKNTVPFVPPISGGIVIKVQENAVIIASTLPYPNSPMYRFHIRLQGIQFLENSTKPQQTPQEALEKYILYKEVTLQNMKTDTYGGILADVYVKNRNINLWMVENKYATLYRSRKNGTPRSRI